MRIGGGGRSLVSVLTLCLLLPFLLLEAKASKWAHDRSALEPDETIVWGSLDNGFRYALKPHRVKPGLVSMRFMVNVGSLDEEDEERGLAHFIEHMAFEGTRSFQPGELIEFFQRLGMSYGVDVNAFTYHDKTVYHLELPQNDAELIGQGLRLYRDYADGMLFDVERVENEREVILREKQARDSPSSRISQASFRFSFDGTKLADRNPIGLEWVVKEVSVERLKAFYRKWYRPDLMTLVVVGDIDVGAFEKQIEAAFGDLEKGKGKTPRRKIGRLARSKAYRSGYLDVDGVERYTLEVSRSWMERNRRDSWERREHDALRAFATDLFNERCRVLIDGMSDNFANYNRVYGIPYCQLTISSGGDFWWDAFVWMDQLLRQVIDYGFTEQELVYLQKAWLQSSRSSVLRYESAEPRALIDELVDSISQEKVYLSPLVETERMDSFIESITLSDVNKAFRETWKLNKLSYFMAGDIDRPLSEDLLKRRIQDDRKLAVLPYIPKLPEKFEYTDLVQAGSVVEAGELSVIGAKTFRFSNNARLTFLQTENEKDTVRAVVRIGGGMLAFTDTNPGTHALAMNSLFRSGFGDHDIESVYKEIRSNVISFVFGLEDHDAFTYRVLAQSEGLDEFFKIVREYLLNPRIDTEAFTQAQSKYKQRRELEPDGLSEGYRTLNRMLYPEQPRFHSPSALEIASVDPVKVREWLEDPFREGYLEVAVIGDIDEDALIEMFGETLGALPSRRESKVDFDAVRSIRVDTVKGKRTIEYRSGMGDNAVSVVVWTIQDKLDLRESGTLYVLSHVLESRIREKVREEMGVSYAPSVNYITFPAYETLRHIRADVDCLKIDAEDLLDDVLEIAAELAEEPISQDELRSAVAPLEEGLRQAWKDNAYLLDNILYGAQEYPSLVLNALQYKDGLLSTITPEELQEAARMYLKSDDALAVAIIPSEASKLAEGPELKKSQRAGALVR